MQWSKTYNIFLWNVVEWCVSESGALKYEYLKMCFKFKLEYYISILPLVNMVQRRLINGLVHTPIHLISLPRLITSWLGEQITLLNTGLAKRARGIADE